MLKRMPLGYDYNALEPEISAATLYIHYNKHYLNYLDKLNELLEKYNVNMTREEIIANIDMFDLKDRATIIFNLGGVLNHELYFKMMSKSNNSPIGILKDAINKSFGSFDKFKEEFISKANSLRGSGYTFLVVNNDKLFIMNAQNQQTPRIYGLKPILTIDLWEHAYYLDYINNRNAYIDNWFTLIDFNKVKEEYEKKS